MNLNPSLIMGQALKHIDGKHPEIKEYDRQQLSLRVYDAEGSGFHFIRAYAPGRWYYRDNANADHEVRADMADVETAVNAGGRVQIVGTRGQSYGVWSAWEQFAAEVLS